MDYFDNVTFIAQAGIYHRPRSRLRETKKLVAAVESSTSIIWIEKPEKII